MAAAPQLTAVITGATGGIGLELARCCARAGYRLVLVGRRADRLQAVAAELAPNGNAIPLVIDLAAPEGAATLVEQLKAQQVEVDVLINNAGVGLLGEFATLSWEQQRDMITLNIVALTALTRAVLPGMVARGQGKILNVASTAAFQPGPLMAVYYATKAYVLSFSEALAEEVKATGVTVTALCPGPTATQFAHAAGLEQSRLFGRGGIARPAAVARVGFAGMQAGKRVVIVGYANRIAARVVRVLPRAITNYFVQHLHTPQS